MLQNRDFRNSIQETELIEMQKVRVRRDRPNGITWAFALAVTMLFVYLATLAIPEKDAEPVGAQITRGIQLEPVSAAFVSLGAYPDALNARVAAAEFMQRGAAAQPFIAALVGLIPNCASSVVITQCFLKGGILFGSCVAGLCANAGLGFVVLLKNTKQWKRNLALIGITYLVSVAAGGMINAFLV